MLNLMSRKYFVQTSCSRKSHQQQQGLQTSTKKPEDLLPVMGSSNIHQEAWRSLTGNGVFKHPPRTSKYSELNSHGLQHFTG
jgi:hypothetical protein